MHREQVARVAALDEIRTPSRGEATAHPRRPADAGLASAAGSQQLNLARIGERVLVEAVAQALLIGAFEQAWAEACM